MAKHKRNVLDIAANELKRSSNKKPRAPKVLVGPESSCFDDLRWSGGTVFATFTKDGSQYTYDMSRAEAKEWFSDDSPGGYFNAEVR